MKEYSLMPGEIMGQGDHYIAYVDGFYFIRIPGGVAESFRTKHGCNIVDADGLKVKARKQDGLGNLVGVVESLDFIELTQPNSLKTPEFN